MENRTIEWVYEQVALEMWLSPQVAKKQSEQATFRIIVDGAYRLGIEEGLRRAQENCNDQH